MLRRLALLLPMLLLPCCSAWPPKKTVLPEPALETAARRQPHPVRHPASVQQSATQMPKPARRVLHYFHPTWRTHRTGSAWSAYGADLNGDGDPDFVLQGVSKADALVIALVSDGSSFELVELQRFQPPARRVFEVRAAGEYHDPDTTMDHRLRTQTVYIRRPGRDHGHLYFWKEGAFRSIESD